jgi:hypothetical protein
MTRQLPTPALASRCSKRVPAPHTLSFTCFHLVEVSDPEPGEDAYVAFELSHPTRGMRRLAVAPRAF